MSEELLAYIGDPANWIDYSSSLATTARAAALLIDTGEFLKSEEKSLGRAVSALFDRLLPSPITSPETQFDADMLELLTVLKSHVAALLTEPEWEHTSWDDIAVSESTRRVPTMITDETMRFYKWLGTRLSSNARIVELGPWLGSSTRCFCEGLDRSGSASLDVYDSFVWQLWMDAYVLREPRLSRPNTGESFLNFFIENLLGYEDRIVVHRCWIDDRLYSDGSPLTWSRRERIELFVYDMGPDPAVLECVWNVFSQFFTTGTILVFNEYGKANSAALWHFCESHADRLAPLYKPYGSAKAFLYRNA
jgi:hypothetical protein